MCKKVIIYENRIMLKINDLQNSTLKIKPAPPN